MGLTVEFEQRGSYKDITALPGSFPLLEGLSFPLLVKRVTAYVGKQAATQLFKEHLQGQDITYHNVRFSEHGTPYDRASSSRRLVSYEADGRRGVIKISSFPLNLYENRMQIRRGDEQRRGILRRKFASELSGRLDKYLKEAERLIVDDWFNGELKNA